MFVDDYHASKQLSAPSPTFRHLANRLIANRCTLSCVYVHRVRDAHSELNEEKVTNERTNKQRKEGRNEHIT